MPNNKKVDEPMPFEKALERLEAIVKEMESGQLSLDRMIAHFEEGSALVKQCGDTLNAVERKIEILVKQNGTVTTAPFEPADEPS